MRVEVDPSTLEAVGTLHSHSHKRVRCSVIASRNGKSRRPLRRWWQNPKHLTNGLTWVAPYLAERRANKGAPQMKRSSPVDSSGQ